MANRIKKGQVCVSNDPLKHTTYFDNLGNLRLDPSNLDTKTLGERIEILEKENAILKKANLEIMKSLTTMNETISRMVIDINTLKTTNKKD